MCERLDEGEHPQAGFNRFQSDRLVKLGVRVLPQVGTSSGFHTQPDEMHTRTRNGAKLLSRFLLLLSLLLLMRLLLLLWVYHSIIPVKCFTQLLS